jgi:methionyl-tRNA formyltransferase
VTEPAGASGRDIGGAEPGSTRALFFGSGPFALPILARLAERAGPPRGGPDADHAARAIDLIAVITAPSRQAGRGGQPQPTPVAVLAGGLGIPVITPSTLRGPAVLEQLAALRVELIILADYGRLIPQAVLDLPRHGALNLHPSLLPRHRGAAPVAAAILAGDATTGVTLMRMDAGLDTGPLIAQRVVALRGDEVAPQLEARLAEHAADLLLEALPGWLSGTLQARPQPEEGATLTRPLRRGDGRLDPSRPAVELARQVRAYQPWPGSWTELEGQRLIVWSAAVVDLPTGPRSSDVTSATPVGEVGPAGASFALRTADGWLRLDEVQPAGGRRMSGEAFRRGLRRPLLG